MGTIPGKGGGGPPIIGGGGGPPPIPGGGGGGGPPIPGIGGGGGPPIPGIGGGGGAPKPGIGGGGGPPIGGGGGGPIPGIGGGGGPERTLDTVDTALGSSLPVLVLPVCPSFIANLARASSFSAKASSSCFFSCSYFGPSTSGGLSKEIVEETLTTVSVSKCTKRQLK